jgi:hypothetical protein
MARLSPEQQIKRILQAIQGWEKEAPGVTFSRRTLAQFKEAMQPSLDAHDTVLDSNPVGSAIPFKDLLFQIFSRTKRIRKRAQNFSYSD